MFSHYSWSFAIFRTILPALPLQQGLWLLWMLIKLSLIQSLRKPIYMGLPHSREGNPTSHQSVPPPDGKENKKKGAAKKSSCNCKKSRCLKLYCECFAAERFCQGCNCSDCGNTPENSEERDKAIKDTRAKNSTAFVNRFSVENPQGAKAIQKVHNMGCKCKKSACLKKYCEVSKQSVLPWIRFVKSSSADLFLIFLSVFLSLRFFWPFFLYFDKNWCCIHYYFHFSLWQTCIFLEMSGFLCQNE